MSKSLNQDYIRRTLNGKSNLVAGKVLAELESVLEDDTIKTSQALPILKKLCKNVIHQEFRHLKNEIKFHHEGRTYERYDIYKPSE